MIFRYTRRLGPHFSRAKLYPCPSSPSFISNLVLQLLSLSRWRWQPRRIDVGTVYGCRERNFPSELLRCRKSIWLCERRWCFWRNIRRVVRTAGLMARRRKFWRRIKGNSSESGQNPDLIWCLHVLLIFWSFYIIIMAVKTYC